MRNTNRKQIAVVVIAVVFTFALLFVANNLFDTFKNQKPLETYLSNHENIEEFYIEKINGNSTLSIILSPNSSFKDTAEDIETYVTSLIPELTIVYKDNPSTKLMDIYSEYHLEFYEHISVGSFGYLSNISKIINDNEEIISRFETDGERVFITFVDNNHFLYKIIKVNLNQSTGRV